MLVKDHLLTFYFVVLSAHVFRQPILARSCYECASTFPSSQICLPLCVRSYRNNSTCFLERNIALDASKLGTLRAGHTVDNPLIIDAKENEFIFGEEAVYRHPSPTVGWDWVYGPLSYRCDTEYVCIEIELGVYLVCNRTKILNQFLSLVIAMIHDWSIICRML
jgi:hypothetical protein